MRACKKLRHEELLVTTLGATVLRTQLDKVPLWCGNHVALRQLGEDFASYLYLPRLSGPEVLARSVGDGLSLLTWQTDGFAYAESYDEEQARYRGLRAGLASNLKADAGGLVVKSDIAKRQIDAELTPPPVKPGAEPKPPGEGLFWAPPGGTGPQTPPIIPAAAKPRRFHGAIQVDAARAGRDASRVAEEVIAHLSGQLGAKVTVTLEIEALLPDGASDQIVRTVTENCRTLKFASHGFEEE